MIVLDANVLVKLLVREPLSEVADRVAQAHALILAPELARLEVASAITRKVRREELTRAEAEARLDLWRQFLSLGNVRLLPDADFLQEAEELSLDTNHSLADCLYLAVARRNETTLATADQPFLDALRGRFPFARHLCSFAE